MFNPFSKKTIPQNSQTVILKITGMHCTSCAVNIDLELEELEGVIDANTNYQKSLTKIQYYPELSDPATFQSIIKKLGYDTKIA